MRYTKILSIFLALAFIATASGMLMAGVHGQPEDPTDEEALGAAMCLTGASCIFPLIMLVVGILIAVWVYKDASKRGMNGILWLIIVVFLGIIGLIIYLVVRRDHPIQQPGYPGAYPPPAPGYAPPPGYHQPPPGYPQAPPPAQPGQRMCMGCGRQIPMNYNACPHCGKPQN